MHSERYIFQEVCIRFIVFGFALFFWQLIFHFGYTLDFIFSLLVPWRVGPRHCACLAKSPKYVKTVICTYEDPHEFHASYLKCLATLSHMVARAIGTSRSEIQVSACANRNFNYWSIIFHVECLVASTSLCPFFYPMCP